MCSAAHFLVRCFHAFLECTVFRQPIPPVPQTVEQSLRGRWLRGAGLCFPVRLKFHNPRGRPIYKLKPVQRNVNIMCTCDVTFCPLATIFVTIFRFRRRANARNVSIVSITASITLITTQLIPVCLPPRRRSYLVLLRAGITHLWSSRRTGFSLGVLASVSGFSRFFARARDVIFKLAPRTPACAPRQRAKTKPPHSHSSPLPASQR